MGAKWTDAQREKFIRTMAAKRRAREVIAKPPRVRRVRPGESAEFARFMAAAWKLFKGR